MTVIGDDEDKGRGRIPPFTDGDLRRALDEQIDIRMTPMSQAMTRNPKCIAANSLATQATHLMELHRITALP